MSYPGIIYEMRSGMKNGRVVTSSDFVQRVISWSAALLSNGCNNFLFMVNLTRTGTMTIRWLKAYASDHEARRHIGLKTSKLN